MFPTQVKPGTVNTINWSAYSPTTSLTQPFSSPLQNIAAPKPAAAPAPVAAPKPAAPAQTTFSTPLTNIAAPKTAAPAPVPAQSFSTPLTNIAAPKPAAAAPAPSTQIAPANLGPSYFNAGQATPVGQQIPPQTAQVQNVNTSAAPQYPAVATPTPQIQNPTTPTPAYSPTSIIGQTPNFQNYVQGSASAAAGAIPIGQQAQQIGQQYGQQIADVGQQAAKGEAAYATTGTSPVGEGNSAVIAQTAAQQQSALAAGESAALQGTGQQLTAEQQAASGLNTAAGQIAPQLGQKGTQEYYSPLDGSSGGGSSAFSGGVAQGQQALGAQYAQMNAANQAAKSVSGTITNYLSANPDLNPSNATAANSLLQWAQGKQLGDARYQTLYGYLNDYTAKIATVLGVGGDTTNLKTEIAQSMVNGLAQGQSIIQVMNNINAQADASLSSIASAGQGQNQVTSVQQPAPDLGGANQYTSATGNIYSLPY